MRTAMAAHSQLISTSTTCLRQLSHHKTPPLLFFSAQRRGKKKLTRDKNVLVRLNQDLPGYGRKGSIVPMIRGQMRNVYFPQRLADYITIAEKKDLKQKDVVIERDVTFGMDLAQEGAEIKEVKSRLINQPSRRVAKQATPVRIELDLLKPPDAYNILDKILPEHVVFYRTPIPPRAPNDEHSGSGATPQSPEQVAPTFAPTSPVSSTPIYGSVSTGDVATAVKALIVASEISGRIVINDEDVRFLDPNGSDGSRRDDKDRVKQLGDYDIEIKIKGHDTAIARRVRVLAEGRAGLDAAEVTQAMDELAALAPIKGNVNPRILEAEARTEELVEVASDLGDELEQFLKTSRLAKEPIALTPAEEAEIETGGDMVSSTRGTMVVVEEADLKSSGKRS